MNVRFVAAGVLSFFAGCSSCLDLDKGREYPCRPDAGDSECKAGFRCGLEGYCHAAGVAAPYVCASNADCEGGWHCGQSPQSVCHPDGLAADYVCSDDSHCEGGWRCGFDGRCLNPTGDALRGDVYSGPLSVELLSPLLRAEGPQRVTVGTRYTLAVDGGLRLVVPGNTPPPTLVRPGVPPKEFTLTEVPLPGVVIDGMVALGAGTLVTHPHGLLHVYVSSDGGSTVDAGTLEALSADALAPVDSFTAAGWSRAGGGWVVTSGVTAASTIISSRLLTTEVIGDIASVPQNTRTAQCMLVATAQGLFVAPRLPSGSTAFMSLKNRSSLAECGSGGATIPGTRCQACTLASGCVLCGGDQLYCPADGGVPLYPVAPSPGYLPNAPLLAHSSCPGTAAPGRIKWLRSAPFFTGTEARGLLTVVSDLGDGGEQLALYETVDFDGGAHTGDGDCGRVDLCDSSMPVSPVLYDHTSGRGCPTGSRLIDARPARDVLKPGNAVVETVCEDQNGSALLRTFILEYDLAGDYGDVVRTNTPSAISGTNAQVIRNPAQATYAGSHGELWAGVTVRGVTPLTLDRAPVAAVAPGGGLLALTGDGRYAALHSGLGLVVDHVPGTVQAPFGEPAAAVRGEPYWVLMRDGLVGDLRADAGFPSSAIARLAADESPLQSPYTASTWPLADGGELLVVTASDRLLTADVSGARPEQLVRLELETRLVPQQGSTILSVALGAPVRPDGGALFAQGYVLHRNGLLAVTATAPNRWQTRAVEVPEGLPLRAWFDGNRGRLGYDDGRVIALPSRVLLAEPLPGEARVFDFAQLRGQPYALGAGGLYRLKSPDGGSLGTWESVAGATAADFALQSFDPGLEGSLLHEGPEELVVFSRFGVTIRVRAR